MFSAPALYSQEDTLDVSPVAADTLNVPTPETIVIPDILDFEPMYEKDTLTVIQRDSVRVYFRVGKSVFQPAYENNGPRLRDVAARVRTARRSDMVTIDRISILASSSPEGSMELNEKLANARAKAIVDYLHKNYVFDDDILDVQYEVLDWDRFLRLVEADPNVPERNNVLEIIKGKNWDALNELKGTACWKYMLKNIYPGLRSTFAVFEYSIDLETEMDLTIEPEETIIEIPPVEKVEDKIIAPEPAAALTPQRARDACVKTNLLMYPLLIPSIGYEFHFADRWSASVLVYYSALNWFNITTKFRVLGLQPEVRYWFTDHFFAGANLTFGWYNIAWNGEYRYQDHKQSTPAYGGGILGGYQTLFPKSKHWGFELTLGAGVMPLHYDIYYNVYNGRLAGDERYTYWGIDNASITLFYRLSNMHKRRNAK